LGQKGRFLKPMNDNGSLFENKTAEVNLRCSFVICETKKLLKDFEKLNLVHHSLFIHQSVLAQNDRGIEKFHVIHKFINLNRNTVRKFNFRPTYSTIKHQTVNT